MNLIYTLSLLAGHYTLIKLRSCAFKIELSLIHNKVAVALSAILHNSSIRIIQCCSEVPGKIAISLARISFSPSDAFSFLYRYLIRCEINRYMLVATVWDAKLYHHDGIGGAPSFSVHYVYREILVGFFWSNIF